MDVDINVVVAGGGGGEVGIRGLDGNRKKYNKD